MPIASRSPATSSYRERSPAPKKTSVPVSAGTLEPDTGASRKRPPRDVTASAVATLVATSKVEQSTSALPAATAASAPVAGAPYTAAAASGVDSIA